jgi:cytochrome c peroxidase
LLGLWSAAPYLHDGSARTLEDAIRSHTGYEDLDEHTLALLISLLDSL